MTKKTVFSGTRASGRLHLGNYLGAIKGYIELSNRPDLECIYMVMDLHATTTPFDPKTLALSTRDIIIDYLAAGLDPAKAIITAQSLVPEHAELAFLFSTVMSVARMQHLPTFKEKVKLHPDNVTMALLNYPVLMAADILLYKASLVPVGIDQEPHLEIAREVARKMNERYFNSTAYFPEPLRFATSGEYIPSLRGEGKMSKSIEGSYINLMDSQDEISKKVANIPTDSGQGKIMDDYSKVTPRKIYTDKSGRLSSGVASLMTFVELFLGESKRKALEKDYLETGIKYGEIKQELATAIYQVLAPIQKKRHEFEADPAYVTQIIKDGALKARTLASVTVQEVKKVMGFIE